MPHYHLSYQLGTVIKVKDDAKMFQRLAVDIDTLKTESLILLIYTMQDTHFVGDFLFLRFDRSE